MTADTATTARYRLVWHRDRPLELALSVPARASRFGALLIAVPPRSAMDRELRRFLASLRSSELPAHRRIDPARARLACSNRGGEITITMTVVDDDFEYATRRG